MKIPACKIFQSFRHVSLCSPVSSQNVHPQPSGKTVPTASHAAPLLSFALWLSIGLFSLIVSCLFYFCMSLFKWEESQCTEFIFPQTQWKSVLASLLNLARVIHATKAFNICKLSTGRTADKCTGWQEIGCLYMSSPPSYHPQGKALFLRKNCQRVRIKLQNHTESQNLVLQ